MTDIPVSIKYTIIKDGKIDSKKVVDALVTLKADIEFLINEYKKVEHVEPS